MSAWWILFCAKVGRALWSGLFDAFVFGAGGLVLSCVSFVVDFPFSQLDGSSLGWVRLGSLFTPSLQVNLLHAPNRR
jgi:hypothetical protein